MRFLIILVAISTIVYVVSKRNRKASGVLSFIFRWMAFINKGYSGTEALKRAGKVIPLQSRYDELRFFFIELKKNIVPSLGTQEDMCNSLNPNVYLNSNVSQSIPLLQSRDTKNIIIPMLNKLYNEGVIDDSSTIQDIYYNLGVERKELYEALKSLGSVPIPIDFPFELDALSPFQTSNEQ